MPSWEIHLTAISDLIVGACCAAVALALAHLAQKFKDLPFRFVYLPFGSFLVLSALAHFSFALGLFGRGSLVQLSLLVLTAVSGLGTVALLRELVRRLSHLADREHDALRREAELTAVVEDLSGAYSRAQELATLKTQVFANVSHELRTPLTLILGPIQELRDSPSISVEQREALSLVERNAQLLLGHVTDLLELSRADAVGVALDRRPTDVVLLLRGLATSFRPLAQSLAVQYEVQLPRNRQTLLIDPEKLERVAMNLLANAFKFTPRGGRVLFQVRFSEVDASAAPELLLSVDDSGPGIRKEDRQAVFERFRQLDSKPNRAFSGTGLGLAIVREFVSASSGLVSVEDSTLGGARFLVSLPAEVTEALSDRDPESLPPSVGSAEMLALRPRPTPEPPVGQSSELPLILVVEDNPDMNRFVTSSLSGEFQVAAVSDGRQALARLETLTPDLIITDFMMPHMSGEEFVHALRSNSEHRDIPVLVLTARDDIELRVRVLSDGVQDWLTKPFTVKELVARARNLTSARRARAILRTELTSREFDVGALAIQLAERKRQLESLLGSLSHALEQAELASRFKTSLLRLVSHELRTPLGALQLQLERLSGEHRGPLNDAQQQLIVRMRRSLARLTDTIQSLLEYARIESGRLEPFVETFDLRELAKSVVDDFAAQAEAKGLRLQLSGAERPEAFATDARLLRLVLVNLVSNALKFTDQGEITLGVESDPSSCRLQVQDTGPGIAANQQAAVFEPFFQGESVHHSSHSQGVGLGLSLVREMLHALGGSIELESSPGAGSIFRISVPRAALSEAQRKPPEQARNTA
ncbi:MAG TPA: ATP-binding protein [Polyangiaceae bacterium]